MNIAIIFGERKRLYMNYGIKLIEMVCDLIERADFKNEMISAYKEAENCPDNFVEGYEERFAEAVGASLGEILEIFYNDTFKYEESTCCEGYGKLTDFLYALDTDVNDIVDELDNITSENCFYDVEGEKINDDEEIRLMRNVSVLYDIYSVINEDKTEENLTFWGFMREMYTDSKKMKEILDCCESDDTDEIWAEWLVCSKRAV